MNKHPYWQSFASTQREEAIDRREIETITFLEAIRGQRASKGCILQAQN